MNNKFENLKKYLNELNEQGICLAFSGGIDSTLLLYLCREMNLKECGVISPLAKFEITKQEIRDYAKICGIEIFNKPSTHCLATRFPYGEKLTRENLDIVEKM